MSHFDHNCYSFSTSGFRMQLRVPATSVQNANMKSYELNTILTTLPSLRLRPPQTNCSPKACLWLVFHYGFWFRFSMNLDPNDQSKFSSDNVFLCNNADAMSSSNADRRNNNCLWNHELLRQ